MRPSVPALCLSLLLSAELAAQSDAIVLEGIDHRCGFGRAERSFERGPSRMTWRPVGAGRGHGAPLAFQDVAPHREGDAICYDHASCVERYEALPNGVEQSFVFRALPAGAGDLVVRLAVTTDLPALGNGPAGLFFGEDEHRGICWGGVTGIAGDGSRAAGTITTDGATIELRLPANFVDGAALPLVLDPLIGTSLVVAGSSAHPDVVGHAGTEVGFATYEASGTIRARRFDGVGSALGASFLVVASGTSPCLAEMTQHSRYVCAYVVGGDIGAWSFDGNGVLGSFAFLEAGADIAEAPDLGSELTTDDDEVLCVYRDATTDTIKAVQVTVSATGILTAGATVTLATGGTLNNLSHPRISKNGGTVGRYLITYENLNLLTGTRSIAAKVVDRNLVVLGTISLGTGDNQDVDGDGDQWIVAFERAGASGDPDIVASAVSWSTTSATVTATAAVNVTALANIDEMNPAVCWLARSALVGWERRAAVGSTDTDLFVKTIDGFTCAQCQPSELLVGTASTEDQLAMAPCRVATGTFASVAGAAVVWHAGAAAGTISYSEFLNGDGYTDQFPTLPACSASGIGTSGCPRVGNTDFRIRLRDAAATATSWLVLSSNLGNLTCGCPLHADPFGGFLTGAIATDGQGNAEQPLAIPNSSLLSGMQFYAQWIVVNPGGACTYLGTDFSTCARINVK